MVMATMMRAWWTMLAVLALAACTDVPLASRALDETAKRFEPPPPGFAALYVVREGTLVSTPVTLLLDRRRTGLLGYDTYFRLELPPGSHDVRIQDLDTGQQLAVTNVQLAIGDIRFVTVGNAVLETPLSSTVTEMTAREVPSAQGRAAVSGKRLAPSGR
jgi:hypothetical protein